MIAGSAFFEDVHERPAVKATDRLVFEAAYLAHRDAVLRYLRIRCRDFEDALDLTAATFERAYRAHAKGDERALSISWLITTARNAAIDLDRRQKVRTAAAWFGLSEPSQGSPESEFIAAEDRSLIATAVRRLSDPTRDAITLRYALGLSTREIAALVGKSEPATQKAIERGLKRLRELLDE